MTRKRQHVETSKGSSKRPRIQTRKARKETDFDFVSKYDYVTVGDLMWHGKTVYEVFHQEFRYADRGYWTREFEEGRILCRGKPLGLRALWKDGMEVLHLVHRHESAVLSQRIHIASDHPGYVVVSKPPSFPVHPCGTYRRNSLQFILKAFYGMEKLHAVHRIDKETSGLVILAKTPEYAARFSAEIKEHKVQKTYLAEVQGIVDWETAECNEPLYWDKRELRSYVRSEGAEAVTSFRRISVNVEKGTSIIECQPLTGRTHQIRVHLMHLGFPIVNDPLYSSKSSSEKAKLFVRDEPQALTLKHPVFENEDAANKARSTYLACEWSKRSVDKNKRHLTCLEEGCALSCSNCPQVTNIKNVEVQAMFIHLHALKYESDSWSFKVPLPPWAPETSICDKQRAAKSIRCVIS